MRKAYHQVWGISVKELLRRGTLNPAIDHVDPDMIRTACGESVRDLVDEMLRRDQAVLDEAVDTLHDIVQHEAEMVEKYQRDEGFRGESTHTNLTCFDILAGDFDKIFCSAFNWLDPLSNWSDPRLNPSGFVFNADFLIDRGAAVRSGDLLDSYKESLQEVIAQHLEPEEYQDAFAEVIKRVLRNHEYEGSQAKDFLSQKERKEKENARKGRKGTIEIVFPGAIPLEWAKEVWHDGKKIKG